MSEWNNAFGFYAKKDTALRVLKSARAQGLRRSALISKKETRGYAPSDALIAWTLVLVIGVPAFHYGAHEVLWKHLPLFVLALVALICWWMGDLIRFRIPQAVLNKAGKWLIGDEHLVFIQVKPERVAEALNLLREVESGHPVSFLIRPKRFPKESSDEETLNQEPFNPEEMQALATRLAEEFKGAKVHRTFKQPLLRNLKVSSRILSEIRHDVAEAEHLEQTITSSAEWLLDNSYVIQGNIEEVQRNLPSKFYQDLPKIGGLPRIYYIAKEMIHSLANKLNRDNITQFLNSYQSVDPLTIGELWALPLILRLRLIECIEHLAHGIDRRIAEGESASFWGNRLLTASRMDPKKLQQFLQMLKEDEPQPTAHFVEDLFDHLFDEEKVLPSIRSWIEESCHSTINDIFRDEQIKRTVEQVAFSSAIVSLITLAQLSWREVFESVSIVDKILSEDPDNIFANMDFFTRDSYRKQVEKLAVGSNLSETDVARESVRLAREGRGEIERHVGYYLIDKGRPLLEKILHFKANFVQSIQRFLLNHPTGVYLWGVVIGTAIIEAVVVAHSESAVLWALAVVPASEIAIQLYNLLLSHILPPFVLPKMKFDKGIPDNYPTLVVIPTMLSGKLNIKENINRLEIHYLANTDKPLRFGIFFDFADSKFAQTENDLPLLEYALNGIKWLEDKYGKDKFFLFYRERVYSHSEGAWIGWERKRGKLEALNRFLVEGEHTGIILRWGNREMLRDIRYVITLDSDTQLPKDTARQLVATICHPLNKPQIGQEGAIERGYTIIQPKVSTNFVHSQLTLFSYIFADEMSVDPYTQAISNVYQDLMKEGTYHGKGIYEVKAFHKLLAGRFPDETILSHDLIEGIFGKVGFASDINLLDIYPKDYLTWAKRQHRWMRGDWQISDWIFSKLSLIDKWKIVDNLRRALLPALNFILLLYGWFFSSEPLFWTLFVVVTVFVPTLTLFLVNAFTDPRVFVMSKDQFINSILRGFVTLAMLPHQAYLSFDAMVRVVYRRLVSKKKLLEWFVSYYSGPHKRYLFILSLLSISLIVAALGVAIYYLVPQARGAAYPLLALWLLSPLVIYFLDRSTTRDLLLNISYEDKLFIRNIARKTWRFFDHFVGSNTNYLPPDNFQSSLVVEIAERTSPTNVGLYLLSILGAYDFRYLTCDALLDRIGKTFDTFKKLDMYEGHFLNWYDTKTLKPLYPRYVSTVDSGNFLASLWALEQGVYDMLAEPILPLDLMAGIRDGFYQMLEKSASDQERNKFRTFQHIVEIQPRGLVGTIQGVQEAKRWIDNFATAENVDNTTYGYWVQEIQKELALWDELIQRYFSWMEIHPAEKEHISLRELGTGRVAAELTLQDAEFQERLARAQWFAGEKMGQARQIIDAIHEISKNMNMAFLYNSDRKLFSIGFNVEEFKLDNSYYDLLASEARIASLVSIAKDDVPLDHWWALSRSYRFVDGEQVLMSWGGTMFEYLMPLLFNNYFPDSLLGEACSAAVDVQMNYGKLRGIPWGISESAFSEIDIRRIYQYRSFGVPGLGFKQGLEEDLVVSPYSSALALAVNPKQAIQNLHRLKDPRLNLLSTYGFYESVDFARQKGPHGERGVTVYAYFAHHQGMSFLSFNNLINHNIVSKRFHSNPRISGIEPLLLEKVPIYPPIAKGFRSERPITRLAPISTAPIMGLVDTPHSTTPKLNLLSNGQLSIMTTNAGGGYTRWKDFDLTRWYSDSTQDSWGSYIYIQDLTSGETWSNGYQPLKSEGSQYSVTFKADKTEIKRRDNDIETITEMVVSPEDDAEIRLVTLANLSKEARTIQLTTYSELSLAPHAADRAHPVFNKMFIETEPLPEFSALLAYRRLRSPSDAPIYAAQLVATTQPLDGPVEWDTDRTRFIGRGHSLENPVALNGKLSETAGYVLDPIFSLRAKITLKPGERVQLSFVTVISDSRDKTVSLVKKYTDLFASHRALDMAWTHSQLELRHLKIHQEEAQLFQKLAGRILYPHGALRPTTDKLRQNKLGQSSLWAYGISGDLPIVVTAIADQHDIELVKQVITAHAFLRMRGLKVDLVILNEETEGYEHPLYHHLVKLVQSYSHLTELNKPGGVFILNADQIPPDDLVLLLAVSNANLIAARGYLRQQLVSPVETIKYGPKLMPNKNLRDLPSNPLPFWELVGYNGYGGFTLDGKEYVIYLDGDKTTPAPWINVMANPHFGTMVTESGLSSTWFGNSQTNRLTPWTNDPLLNPICDTIYIRDDEMGTFWSLTPMPVRENEAYRIRFGQGYTHFEHNSHGLEQELTIFVPIDTSLRVQVVRVKNSSDRKRTISLFGYLEWVLGTTREQTEMHVITEWDPESQALFAYNHYNSDFKDYVAFVASSPLPNSFTANRTEFIGRNHNHADPYAMKRKSLSGSTGAALDPCGALQVQIELEPGETKEVTFVLGYAPSCEAAREMIQQVRDPGEVEKMLYATSGYWDKILNTVQVETPDQMVNFAMNRWLLYQVLSCRYWGRSAFYQSSGAFGFRDQLQDVMALLYTAPEIARAHILESARHQFEEGDVQHWWHPPSNGGVRTRISDDLLWLPFVTAQYIRVTGDRSILDEEVPFLKGDLLKDDQEEAYFVPQVSEEKASLLEHCRRALQKGMTSGPHGLPLIGTGDWNDGMNLVGVHGTGESVWLGWFLIQVLNDFAEMTGQEGYRTEAKRLAEQIESEAWDGHWYKRAYFDDGTPLGSSQNKEDTIDSLPQSWGVISGAADPVRAKEALENVEKHQVLPNEKMVLLLTPPFNTMEPDPGYIKGYPPGVRENGGQYTHGSLWVPMAFARLGEGDKAYQTIRMMQPMSHTETKEAVEKYKVEPYVVVADIYSLPTKMGQGGWSWYTGAAGWMYRIYLEEILGLKVRGDKLTIHPALPSQWDKVKITYLYHNTPYTIEIARTGKTLSLDGQEVSEVTLIDDNKPHTINYL